MENYIRISNLNDFIFCPKSIYFHELYQKYDEQIYKDTPQVAGTQAHEAIDLKKYSTSKNILQSLSVYSEKYNIAGKIDLYDADKQLLIERKKKISKIYDGYRYQVYAQYFCLQEMGYPVCEIKIHSLVDNKSYDIPIPNEQETAEFENLLEKYRKFNLSDPKFAQNPEKCKMCIYNQLCDYYTQTCYQSPTG
ncbi:MAG TPA: type V CRISPR-associated protein Cas4 [Candidatus Absconditabacterales bacterium]|nr:type V CRISPR-associated protein Cas4 [Candidatus Absconditabacterales bacterium]HMT26798.1 type V CRISPR-associated protein Cas4 [Candidatus Absconditabacterales bacterium]